LAHDVRGECCWYGSRGWTFSRTFRVCGFVHLQIFSSKLVNRPQLEARPTRQSYGNQWLQRQLEGAPDDGHNSARNMLSGVYATKQ
jgi:hypothetical protein